MKKIFAIILNNIEYGWAGLFYPFVFGVDAKYKKQDIKDTYKYLIS